MRDNHPKRLKKPQNTLIKVGENQETPGEIVFMRKVICFTQCFCKFTKNKDCELDDEFSNEENLDKSCFQTVEGGNTYFHWIQEKRDKSTWKMNTDNSLMSFAIKGRREMG